MVKIEKPFCLDTNVLIQAWQKYYSPKYCPDYWDVLNTLGNDSIIFIPEEVFDEIVKTDDELSKWLKSSTIPVVKTDSNVTNCLTEIYAKNPIHKLLVDNTKARSLADPWVIAHAMNKNANVVTKEEKITATTTKRIKIPNVCDNMGVRCLNDFEMIEELKIKFTCNINK